MDICHIDLLELIDIKQYLYNINKLNKITIKNTDFTKYFIDLHKYINKNFFSNLTIINNNISTNNENFDKIIVLSNDYFNKIENNNIDLKKLHNELLMLIEIVKSYLIKQQDFINDDITQIYNECMSTINNLIIKINNNFYKITESKVIFDEENLNKILEHIAGYYYISLINVESFIYFTNNDILKKIINKLKEYDKIILYGVYLNGHNSNSLINDNISKCVFSYEITDKNNNIQFDLTNKKLLCEYLPELIINHLDIGFDGFDILDLTLLNDKTFKLKCEDLINDDNIIEPLKCILNNFVDNDNIVISGHINNTIPTDNEIANYENLNMTFLYHTLNEIKL